MSDSETEAASVDVEGASAGVEGASAGVGEASATAAHLPSGSLSEAGNAIATVACVEGASTSIEQVAGLKGTLQAL